MVSFVYLDVGGVANLDFSGTTKWEDLRAELGVAPGQYVAYEAIWSRYLPEVCVTRDIETLVPILKSELGLKLPEDYSLLNGFLRRFEPNPSIWPVVDQMKRRVPVGLLTNMYIGMFAAIQRSNILPRVSWDVVIDSSVVGLQKPDPKIFGLAQAKAGVPGSQILFVDNGAEHVKTAADFGWQTFLYDSSNPQKSSQELAAFFQKC